jgi:hypothetical protein
MIQKLPQMPNARITQLLRSSGEDCVHPPGSHEDGFLVPATKKDTMKGTECTSTGIIDHRRGGVRREG